MTVSIDPSALDDTALATPLLEAAAAAAREASPNGDISVVISQTTELSFSTAGSVLDDETMAEAVRFVACGGDGGTDGSLSCDVDVPATSRQRRRLASSYQVVR